MFFNKKRGFTLIELLVVVTIIGILSSLGIYVFKNFTTLGKERVTISNHETAVEVINAMLVHCQNVSNKFEVQPTGFFSGPQPCNTPLENLPSIFQSHFTNEGFKNPFNKKFPQFDILDTDKPPLGTTLFTFSPSLKILRLVTNFSDTEALLVTDIKDDR